MQRSLIIAVAFVTSAVLIAGCDGVLDDGSPQAAPGAGTNSNTGGSFIDEGAKPKPVTEIPHEVLDYFNRSVVERKRRQRLLKQEIAQLKKHRRAARLADQQQALDSQIAERETKIIALNTSYPVPPLNLAKLHEGIIGGIGSVRVVDVQEGSTGLVCQSADINAEHVVILKLLSFVNLTTGETRLFENAFEITGTQKLPTAGGRERTVFVMKAFRDLQLKPYIPLYEKQQPLAADTESSTPDKTADVPGSNPKPGAQNKPSAEATAAGMLKLAKVFVKKGNTAIAKKRLQAIVDDYPETKAGQEAKTLLDGLK